MPESLHDCAGTVERLDVAERMMRPGLKAQGQSRATLETLAAIKNPPMVFARQANIVHGPQQVSNTLSLRARQIRKASQADHWRQMANGWTSETGTTGTLRSGAGDHERCPQAGARLEFLT
jgi:hypothetical protein